MSDPASGEWPARGLDIGAERARGWRPVPVQQVVLKLVGPCNLACDYCYVYFGADLSWRKRPRVASPDVVSATARRLGEHALAHRLAGVEVVLHGGEPLLVGPDALVRTCRTLREAIPPQVGLRVSVQTNGTLLSNEMLAVLADLDVRVGVSLDGGPAENDHHRVRHDGGGSHPAVERALRRLGTQRYRHLFSGLLCTIDPRHDPVAVYEALLRFDPPAIDFLLPHRTWDWTPPGFPSSGPGSTPYGDWLVAAFDRWFDAPRRETDVRLFDDVVHLLLGGSGRSGQVGLSPAAFVVVDTDGTWQQVDALKVVAAGAPETGLDVFTTTLDDVCSHPAVVARQLGLAALAGGCRDCRLVRVCGGGHYPHRHRRGSGFRHPSVYCHDLQVLIDHVARRLTTRRGEFR